MLKSAKQFQLSGPPAPSGALFALVSPLPGLQPGEQLQGTWNIPLMQGDLRERTEAFAPLQGLSAPISELIVGLSPDF
jgi:hypothetical protein